MARQVPLNEIQRTLQSAWGVQDELTITAVPAAASQALVNQKLNGQTLTTDGVYTCLVPMSGAFTELEVHIRATFGAGTVTVGGPDILYYVANANDPDSWTVKTAGTGDGALTTTVRLSPSVTGMTGEQYAMVTLTLAGVTSVAITQAEYNGF